MNRFLKVPLMLVLLLVIPAGSLRAQVVIMHSFAGGTTDGDAPSGALVQIGSSLFGTAEVGGSFGDGTIFNVGIDGTNYSTTHSLSGNDGLGPFGSLVQDGSALYGLASGGGSAGLGTLFNVGVSGAGGGVVHQFLGSPSDGSVPEGSLVQSGSTLFGTTGNGGAARGGTIFRTSIDGSGYSIIHPFSGGTNDGSGPNFGAPALSGASLYGMTVAGGVSNTGVIYKVGTDGSGYSILHSFTLSPTDGNTPFGSVIASGSMLYGMTTGGGSSFAGTVFRMDMDGSDFTILHSFAGGPNDGNDPLGELLLSGDELYGMTYRGGSANMGTIFDLGIDGSNYEVLHSFTGGPNDGANPASDLIQIGSTFYGTTVFGGANNDGTVFSFTPVPEPSSLLLTAAGVLPLLLRRRWIGRLVQRVR